MVYLQKEFIDFHDEIKLDDENQILRDKRNILLNKLGEVLEYGEPFRLEARRKIFESM